jgi:hypothetical protein
MKNINLLLLSMLFFPTILSVQKGEEIFRELHKNCRFGGIGGVSYLAFELKKIFSRPPWI